MPKFARIRGARGHREAESDRRIARDRETGRATTSRHLSTRQSAPTRGQVGTDRWTGRGVREETRELTTNHGSRTARHPMTIDHAPSANVARTTHQLEGRLYGRPRKVSIHGTMTATAGGPCGKSSRWCWRGGWFRTSSRRQTRRWIIRRRSTSYRRCPRTIVANPSPHLPRGRSGTRIVTRRPSPVNGRYRWNQNLLRRARMGVTPPLLSTSPR